MSNEMASDLMAILWPTVVTIGTLLLSFLGAKVGSFLNAKISQTQQDQIMNVIMASVQFVEQVSGGTFKGKDKLLLAKQRAREVLNGMGILITDEELTMWIEAFLNGLNESNKEAK